jgi:hypothetical protein
VRLGTLVILVLVIGISGCNNPKPQFGITREGEDIVVLWKPCDSNTEAYELEVMMGARQVIWRITASEGSDERRFVLGVVPDDFSVDVPWIGELPDRASLRVALSTSSFEDWESFNLQEIHEGRVFIPRRGLRTFEEFERFNTCEDRGLLR